jgi:capsular exopolysaccharide synthesis family protein
VDLRRYAAIVWRRKWVIIAIVVAALAGTWASGGLEQWRPRFRATATLLVTTAPGQPVPYPVDAIRTLPVAREAVRIAGTTADPATVLANLTVAPRPDTALVGIQIEDSDPERAARLANAFAETYLVRLSESVQVDADVLGILREVHEDLRDRAAHVQRSSRDATAREWELHWLRVQDEFVARAYSDASLRQALGARATIAARLIEPATPPTQPLETVIDRQIRAMGGVGGMALLVALSLAFLLEYVDDRVRTAADATDATGLPVLATLPSRRRIRRGVRAFSASRRQAQKLEGLVRPPPSPIPDPRLADAVQGLRVQLSLAARERPLRTVLIASPHASRDRGVVAAFLGTAEAQAGRPVVLISADLHRPALEELFGLEPSPGLGEAATGDAEPTDILRPTWIPKLTVVSAGVGRAHPADVLASERVGEIFEAARGATDLVVVDAPPVLAGMEASILVSRCDAVLLVLEGGATTREQARAARAELEKVRNGAVFLGLVLSNMPDSREARRYNGRRPRGRSRRRSR